MFYWAKKWVTVILNVMNLVSLARALSSCFQSLVVLWRVVFVCTEWTSDNILRLFTALKTSIPNRDKNVSYIKGLKNVKWETVAFPPFSPSECKEKWMEILQKVSYCPAVSSSHLSSHYSIDIWHHYLCLFLPSWANCGVLQSLLLKQRVV